MEEQPKTQSQSGTTGERAEARESAASQNHPQSVPQTFRDVVNKEARPWRAIICGGRDFGSYGAVCDTLDAIHAVRPFSAVFHGNARGADNLADAWCRSRGVKVFPCPAQWAKHGKRAGPIRNQQMLGNGVDVVIAFPGGRGTDDMMKRAKAAGVPVMRVPDPSLRTTP